MRPLTLDTAGYSAVMTTRLSPVTTPIDPA